MSENITDDKLRKASDHLFYEIWMMKRLAEIGESGISIVNSILPVTRTDSPDSMVFSQSTGVVKTSGGRNDEELWQVLNNTIIESFGIHVRALLDFFYGKAKYDDDVIAEQFFGEPNEWVCIRPPKTHDELKQIRDRVNKEIAHLTYARQEVISKEWPFGEILADVNAVIDIFIESVPKKLLGDRWS